MGYAGKRMQEDRGPCVPPHDHWRTVVTFLLGSGCVVMLYVPRYRRWCPPPNPACDAGYLWGEQFQSMRAVILYVE